MNAERRKNLNALIAELEELEAKRDEIKGTLESLRDEEQDYYDNMPEGFQNGEKGEKAQAAIDAMEDALNELENIDIDAVKSGIETAQE